MATPWKEVALNPEYQALSPQDQAAAKVQYFNEIVRPQLAEADHPAARQQFFSYANELDDPEVALAQGKKPSWTTKAGAFVKKNIEPVVSKVADAVSFPGAKTSAAPEGIPGLNIPDYEDVKDVSTFDPALIRTPAPDKGPEWEEPTIPVTEQTAAREKQLFGQGYDRNQVNKIITSETIGKEKQAIGAEVDYLTGLSGKVDSIKTQLKTAKTREEQQALIATGNDHVNEINKRKEALQARLIPLKTMGGYQSEYEDPWADVVLKTIGNLPATFAKQTTGAVRAIEELSPASGEFEKQFGPSGAKIAADYWSKSIKEGAPVVGDGTLKSWTASALNSVGINIPLLIAGGPVAAAAKVAPYIPGLVAMGVMSGGDTYQAIREKRPDVAAPLAFMAAAGAGATEGLSELIPIKTLFRKDIGIGRKLVNEMIQEIPTEMANTLYTSIQGKLVTDPDMTWGDFLNQQRDTIMSTAIATPMMVGAMHPVIKFLDRQQTNAIEADAKRVNEYIRSIEAKTNPIKAMVREVLKEKVAAAIPGVSLPNLPPIEIPAGEVPGPASASTWTGTLATPFETPEIDLSGIPRETPVIQTTVEPPAREVVQPAATSEVEAKEAATAVPPTFREFIESKGKAWPITKADPDWEGLKAEYDSLGKEPLQVEAAKTESTGPTLPAYLEDVAQNSIDSVRNAVAGKDADALKNWLHTDNKNLRQYFTDLTGVKLPKTQTGTKDVIDTWAIPGIDAGVVRILAAQYDEKTIPAKDSDLKTEVEIQERINSVQRQIDALDEIKNPKNFDKHHDKYKKLAERRDKLSSAIRKLKKGGSTDGQVQAKAEVKKIETLLGKNLDGEDIYEDKNGIRHVVKNGRKIQEPVAMIPTRAGVMTSPSMPRGDRFQVLSDTALEALKNKPATEDNIIKEAKDAGHTNEEINAALREGEKVGETEGAAKSVTEIKAEIQALAKELGVGFAPEIKVEGKWNRNGLVFATEQEAADWASDRHSRWMMSEGHRAVPVSEAPNWKWEDGELKEIKEAPKAFGSGNKLFTEDKANKAREILRKKFAGLNMGVPLDPEIIQAGIDLAGYYIEGGSRTFVDYSKKMIADLGDVVRPYLKSFYMAVRNYPGFDKTGMNNEAEVDNIDENSIDITKKEGKLEVKGGEGNERPRDGSTGAKSLEENRPGALSETGEGGRPGEGKRGSGKTNDGRDESLDADQDTGTGSLAGEPAPIHLQDEGTVEGGLPGLRSGGLEEQSTPASEPRTVKLSGDNPGNYRITPEDDIGSGTRGQKIDRNIAAIRLVKQLEEEKRYPTKAEQSILAKYVGWGGLKSVFGKGSTKPTPQDTRAREELERLLTKDEIQAAFLSITDAHYTSPEIISSIYDVLRHMGFEGGNVLEPTYGAGNFIGLMPEDLAASSKWYGSELDPITAKIGKYLYPDSQLIESGFQVAEFPFGKFDLAVGNPPFGDLRIADTKKSRAEINRFKIHNYVIAKEGMHLKPGGILANVVTTRFLDTPDPEARDFLAKNFRFLAAIRLPNDAFTKNAGTTVTTDLVFLQRLMPDEKPDMKADWLTTGATMKNSAGETVTLNKYFVSNPQMMLGEPSMKGTMYGGAWKTGGKGEFTLDKREGEDTGKLIKRIINNVEFADLKGIMNQRAGDKADAAALSLTVNKEDVGIGGFYVDGNTIYRRGDDDQYDNPTFEKLTPWTQWTEKTKLGETRYNRIKGMLNLRAKAYKLIEAERFDRDDIEALRKDLNKDYDAYVKEFGYLSESANFGLMSDDVKIEFGLESGFKKAITPTRAKALGIKPSPAVAIKSSILTKRVFYPSKEIIFAKDVTDGYGISLSQKGRLNVEYIAELTGKSVDDVTAELSELGLAYEDPGTGKWIQQDEYLSGNVKAKHKIAVEKGFEKNATALKKVFPADVGPEEVFAGFGANWIPQQVYTAFAEFAGIVNPRITISHDTGRVYISGDARQNDVNVAWQNQDHDIGSLLNAAAGKKGLVAYDGSGDDRTVNKERTKGLSVIVKQVKTVFNDWLFAEQSRANTVTKEYNDTQNTHAKRSLDGKNLHTVGASPAVNLRNTQRNAAWRMIQSPVVLLDHAVGAGKTFTIITGVMERVRMGLTKKAMIVVPNHLVGQWAADWMKLYPGAKILAATNKDFTKSNRRRLFARIATGDYDAVIVGHSSFGFVPVEREAIRNLVQEEIEHLERAEREAIAAGEKRIASGLAKRIQKKRERIVELMSKPRDNVSHFEQMGIDHLVVDESHEFKNLEYSSAMQNITGMGNPSGSKRAFDLYSKIRWLKTQEGSSITFATGTPISNSLVEMYSLLRYLNREELVKRKLEAFDAWASAYATTENKIEYTASQKLKDRVVMSTFNNVPELLQLYEEFADSITMDDLKRSYAEQIRESNRLTGANEREEFPVPKVETGGRQLDVGEADEAQRKYVDYLVARAQRLEELGRENDPKVDNHLWLMGDARKMALDIRLVDPTAKPGKNNKINRAAKNIKAIYDKWNADKGTQLVFCDLSTPVKTASKDAKAFINEALKVAKLKTDAGTLQILDSLSTYHEKWAYLRHRIEAEIEAISDHREGETSAYMQRREALESFLNEQATDSALADLTTADTGFSVYDDLKATLIKKGIPAGEIKYVHEFDGTIKKQELFDLVNSGAVRVLIGSTPKMGAGMNAQERMVAIHHMDAPWRPSDVEQREGRLVRQGNVLYERDPGKFKVSIHAYSTANTFDAVMWQILARKQEMLDDFRSGRRRIDDSSNDSASYADFMAETTGNPAFKEKFKLEGEIEELAATMRRIQTRRQSAESSLRYSERKREELKGDIARFEEVQAVLKTIDNSNFAYEGKEYENDIEEAEKKERERLRVINEAAEAEHKPIYEKVWEGVQAKYPDVESPYQLIDKSLKDALELYESLLEEAGITRYAKVIQFDRAALAKKNPKSATAAAEKIRKDVNGLPEDEGGKVTFSYGDVQVTIKASPLRTRENERLGGPVRDYQFFVNGKYVTGAFDRGMLTWDVLSPFLDIGSINDRVRRNIDEANSHINRLARDDERATQTLEKLEFTDADKLAAKRERYTQVVAEVNELEAQMEAKREEDTNKYIENDIPRFGDYTPASRRRVEAVTETATAKEKPRSANELDALRAVAKESWEDYRGKDEYPIWEAKAAFAEAVLSQHGEGSIDTAQNMLDEAKDRWRNDWETENDAYYPEGQPYPNEILTAKKAITSIRQGQGKLFTSGGGGITLYSGLDITQIPKVLRGLYDKFRLSELWEAYKRPPEVSESKTVIGKYTGALQVIDQKLVEWAWKINKEIPKDRQIAITNYMQAGGDMGLLQERADGSHAAHQKGYADALTLTPEEKQWADAMRARFDEIWKAANDAGIIEDYVENYVRGEWKNPEKAGGKILAQANAGEFRTNPSEARRKIFKDYYEGEQAGYEPKDKRIGYQIVAAERSIRMAIEARKAMKALMKSKEADGRPTVMVGGGGSFVKDVDGTENTAFLVKPNQKGKDTGDYRFLDHPALRKWKWIGADSAGKPILMEGNMWIHPDAFSRINALMGKSRIRSYTIPKKVPVVGGRQPGKWALQAGAFVKGTILIGPFHQFHVGEHAVFHKVNPFNAPEINFDKRPLLKEGVEHGLMLFNHNALFEFGEGLATGGLFHRIPKVGDQLLRYQEWLFQDYIPRLKATMFEHAVERAEKYYEKDLASGKFTRSQLLDNAAKQANAAFGEMNYKYMGRNPTLQDALRIALLAPDFLEARLKFGAQALRPKGKEQLYALVRGAIIMGTLAQVVNMMIGDEDEPDWKKPFTVVYGGREYTPRSVVGDIVHLAASPRSFWYNRLNPLWGRPVVELGTGRDFYGRQPGSPTEAVKNILKSWTAIPFQGLVKDNMGDTILEATVNSLLQSIGMSNYMHKSDFERYAMTEGKRITYKPTEKSKLKYELERKIQRHDPDAMKDIAEARKEGKISEMDLKDIIKKGMESPVLRAAKSMELDDLAKGLKHATAEEMKIIGPIYIRKVQNKFKEGGITAETMKTYMEALKEAKSQ